MRIATIFFLTIAVFTLGMPLQSMAARDAADAGALPPHALKDSASLYLRDAASGPVRWQPWSEAAFALARKVHRPVLIDIGAVWCHWCHVMDQTTYADPKVAATINRYFVPIKVDTDERPDIDSYYQAAAQTFSAGGWPLTCFAAPDGAPMLIAGYFPPDASERHGMLWVLDRVKDAYAHDPNFTKFAHEVAAKVSRGDTVAGRSGDSLDQLRMEIINRIEADFVEPTAAQTEGPRFYDFPAIRTILAHGFFGHPEFTSSALTRLKTIAAGGVYDQLGGGFHRYSVDANWRVPHFEKMAYDQAMAIRTYAEAYEATHDEYFAKITRSIVGYVNSAMLDPKSHEFYSHQDADSFPGDDGSYYTWSEAELRKLLGGRELEIALLHFGFDQDAGRAPDGRIVLRDAMSAADIASKLHITPAQARSAIDSVAAKMLAAREKRRAPEVDRSVLIDRNSLMASAYLTAAIALDDDSLKRTALSNLDHLYDNARAQDGSFYHLLGRRKPGVPGLIADQVYMMGALLDAYQATGDRKFLNRASSLGDLIFASFRDFATGLLTNRVPVTRGTVLATVEPGSQVFYDDPTPAIQAAAAQNFQTLAAITSEASYLARADQLLHPASNRMGAFSGPDNGALGLALENRANGEAVIAIAGTDDSRSRQLLLTALATYRPGKVVIALGAGTKKPARVPDAMRAMVKTAAHRDAPIAFMCAGTACANPVTTADALGKTIRDFGVNRGASGNVAAR